MLEYVHRSKEKYHGAEEKNQRTQNKEPPVSGTAWEKAWYYKIFETQKHFKTSRHNAKGRAKVNYLLSCKAYCGYCGAMLDAESGHGRSGKVYNYYKCSAKKRGADCPLKPIPKEKLEDAVIDATCKQILTPEMIDELTEKIMEVQEEQPDSAELVVLKKRLKDNEKRQKNLLQALEEGTSHGAIQRLKELEDEASQISLQISKKEIEKPQLTAELVSDWLFSFCAGDVTDPAFRKKLLETFVSRVDIWTDHAIVYFNYTGQGNSVSTTITQVDLNQWYSNPDKPLVLAGLFLIYLDL